MGNSKNGILIVGKFLRSKKKRIVKSTFCFSILFIHICQLKAQSWSELGTGINALHPNNVINHIACDTSGNVYAAGHFTNSSGKWYIANWNGASWGELGSSTGLATINGLYNVVVSPTGSIYSCYENSDGHNVAKLTGTTWSPVGSGMSWLNCPGSPDLPIAIDVSESVYAPYGAGSDFMLFKYSLSTWFPMGSASSHFAGDIFSILPDGLGNIYIAGKFPLGGKNYVAKWNGSFFSQVGTGTNELPQYNANTSIRTLAKDASGNIYAAGEFRNPSSGYWYVAKWNGTNWFELGSGANSLKANAPINSIVIDNSGNVYAAGEFKNASGWRYVAKWDGTTWSELGGTNGLKASDNIYSLVLDNAGNVYAGGNFANTDGYRYVAKFSTLPSNVGNEHSNTHLVKVHPNPASQYAVISGVGLLTVLDPLGQKIQTQWLSGTGVIDVHTLPDGLYICRLQNGETVSCEKLIVSH